MEANHGIQQLTASEKERIHRAVLRILAEIGVKVESNRILDRLADFGADVNRPTQVARFPQALIERFIGESEPAAERVAQPRVECSVGIYIGKYLNPRTNQFEDWTEDRMAAYVKAAKAMPNVTGIGTLGCPTPAPHQIHPLHVKYLCWKLGIDMDQSIQSLELCPFIEEFHGLRAAALGVPLKESMRGTMFLISPLKLAATDAEQFLYFAERGYPCSISNMTTLGGSGPITLAGALAQHLAEDICCNILQRLYYGTRTLNFLCSILPLDMRRAAYCYGRPENAIANLLHGQMARFYGAQHVGQTGLADAKQPGSEAVAQKMMTVIPSLLYFNAATINAGLLSGDEVCSPIQLIIDNELADALNRLGRCESFDDEHLAFETIRDVGAGGGFIGADHTAAHVRTALWKAPLFSHSGLHLWQSKDGTSLEDRARRRWEEIMDGPDPAPGMDEATEQKVKALLDRALKTLEQT